MMENKLLLFIGLSISFIDGFTFPAMGVLISKIIANLISHINGHVVSSKIYIYCYAMIGVSLLGFFTNTVAWIAFSMLGEKTVRKIRLAAYQKIINMPIDWFAKEENQAEKVTSLINSGSKNLYSFAKVSITFAVSGIVNVFVGIIGSLVFEWRTGLTSIVLVPLILLSQVIQLSFVSGFSESSSKIFSESNQIVNEKISNIRTALSIGDTTLIEQRYENTVDEISSMLRKKCCVSGFMFGISYFLQFVICGLLFYLAAVYINTYNVSAEGSLGAIFLLGFACVSAGNSINYVEDIAGTETAAKNLFGYIDLED
jgi:ABC-type multidrug transport system fused ATPase/permease subunit